MLYVQFDQEASAATSLPPPAGTTALLRVRHLGDVLDGLELRATEPAVALFRFAVAVALGNEALATATWRERGLDAELGFTLALGEREAETGRWPLGLAAFAARPAALTDWLRTRGITALDDEGLLTAGAPAVARLAAEAARAPWSDAPYLELRIAFGAPRRLGGLWAAATRRGSRFQAEMVARLPGLPPLHVIARDPPAGVAEIIPPEKEPPVALRRSADEPAPARDVGPPTWDEPGPCDCGVPPDLCAMKRFRLLPAEGGAPSPLPGADTLRQLTASLVDLHAVGRSHAAGLRPGDRVVVARSPESARALEPGDLVLDAEGTARPFAPGMERAVLGAALLPLPWPRLGAKDAFRQTFSGLWWHMEAADIRIGWLKMLLGVFRRHGKGGLYDELIAHAERMIADAERERAGGRRVR